MFLFIPVQAFAARCIFFRKSGFNFLENMVVPLYTMGHWYWFSILTAIYYKITGVIFNGFVEMLLQILYMGFAYTSFITYQSKLKSFFKGMGVWVAAYFIFIFSVIIIAIIVILLFAWLDPETLRQLKPSGS